MKPVFALVGRPNVGKSTLFNKLTRSRDALVADLPGLTRDRQYGIGKLGEYDYIVIDTGGLNGTKADLNESMARQTRQAMQDADSVLFMVDGRTGTTPADEELARTVRHCNKPTLLVINKTDGMDAAQANNDFFNLGFARQVTISASHSRGLKQLLEQACAQIPARHHAAPPQETDQRRIGIAIAGRPNVGKSTLINRLLGEERVIASDLPGTTRDSISVPFERHGNHYTLIDTAGVRRRGKVGEVVEKFSVIKTLQAITTAHVTILLLDAQAGLAEQDLHLADYIISSGRALVIAINKCDAIQADQLRALQQTVARRLEFAQFARTLYISARSGNRVGQLLKAASTAYRSAMTDMATPQLTRMLAYAVQQHQPPMINGRRIKLRYAHQGGSNPPRIIIHGNQTGKLPTSYRRYLSKFFSTALHLEGTPLQLECKSSANPYQGKKPARDRAHGGVKQGFRE